MLPRTELAQSHLKGTNSNGATNLAKEFSFSPWGWMTSGSTGSVMAEVAGCPAFYHVADIENDDVRVAEISMIGTKTGYLRSRCV
jgi:hypothetical protein